MGVRNTRVVTLESAEVISAAWTGTQINVENYTEASVYIQVTAQSGSSPTLDLNVETSPDNSTWYHHTDVPQIATVSTTYYAPVVALTNIGEYLRMQSPLPGGTTPSFTVTIIIVLKN